MTEHAQHDALRPIEAVYDFFADVDRPGRWVVRSDAELREMWARLVPREVALPRVDFGTEMLVCATQGICGGSWPRLSFDGYAVEPDAVQVRVRITGPPAGYGSDSAGTFQFLLVGRMPRHDARVEFVDRLVRAGD
jgi:hypothetical protein